MMKKVPMRMCVACREMKPKKELRGAYLCRSEACLNKALKIRALDRALEQPLSEAAVDALRQVIAGGGNEAL